ncbi:NUC153 domain-containing protein [Heracleum sosnowskyi]|uniref:NUC153 domain-containing protein n=1 Tax=Heracleum sosnowskyi TaxID=360622 RepID=A0AAD8MA44_9APIA|nr:NUC153 domain-containing protein [Heracleum sosnowskyi]
MDSKKKNNEKKSNGSFQKVITDPRFASVHSDPRFHNPPKHKSKVTIDSRFNRMFTDKNFTSSSTRIDKRGKVRKEDSLAKNPLKHYYRLDERGEEGEKGKEVESEDGGSEGEIGGLKKEEVSGGKIAKLNKGRGNVGSEDEEESDESGSHVGDLEEDKGGVESEEEDEIAKLKNVKLKNAELESSDSEMESDEDEEEEEEDGVDEDSSSTGSEGEYFSEEENNLALEENVPEIENETRRLAVVNMDWNQVKAVDLYVLLSSFLPKGGEIISVSIYPSEFGLKRMEEEAVHGPVGLFDDDEDKNASDDEGDDVNEEIDIEKLRAYELSRLRYYYAVVECDSIATADYIYKSCDGVEVERSSNKLDLRFIPDSMEFKHTPRDVATEAPGSYEGNNFETRALQQTKVRLTWDEDEPQRSKTLKRKYTAEQLAELELKEFLASDGSESDENENNDDVEDGADKKNKKQHMYRALIESGDASDEDDEQGAQEMEVTFNTGLEDISKQILEKKDRQSETVWEAYLRKRKEKKKASKNRSKYSSEDESSDSDREPVEETDDFFVEEPHAKQTKGAQRKSTKKGKQPQETTKEAEASRAELELLLADETGNTNLKGYNLKPKKSKGKKGKEIHDEEKLPTIDDDDRKRFSVLLNNNPLYALDPTDPQYKRSAAFARQVAQKHKKDNHEETGRNEPLHERAPLSDDLGTGRDEHVLPETHTRKDKHEISSLVKSIKMKSKQLPVPSGDKISRKKGTPTDKQAKKARVL